MDDEVHQHIHPDPGGGDDHEPLDGKWYYADETGECCGPYETEEAATDACDKYAEWLNG